MFLSYTVADLKRFLLTTVYNPKVDVLKDLSYFNKPVDTFKYHFIINEEGKLDVVFGSRLKLILYVSFLDLAIILEKPKYVTMVMELVPEWVLRYSDNGLSVFHVAALIGNVEILDILYSNLPTSYRWLLKVKTYEGQNFCELAISLNDVPVSSFCFVKKIISKSDYNSVSLGNMFHYAAWQGSIEVLKMMGDPGMERNIHGGTIYHTMANGLLERGVYVNCNYQRICDMPHHFYSKDVLFEAADHAILDHNGQSLSDILNLEDQFEDSLLAQLKESYLKTGKIPSMYISVTSPHFGYLIQGQTSILEMILSNYNWGLFTDIIAKYPLLLNYRNPETRQSLTQLLGKKLEKTNQQAKETFSKLMRLHKKYQIVPDLGLDYLDLNAIRQAIVDENIFALNFFIDIGLLDHTAHDDEGYTALQFSILQMKIESAKFLIRKMNVPSLYHVGWNATPYRHFALNTLSHTLAQQLTIAFVEKDVRSYSLPNIFLSKKDEQSLIRLFFDDEMSRKTSITNAAESFALISLILESLNMKVLEVMSILRSGQTIDPQLRRPITIQFKDKEYTINSQFKITCTTEKIDLDRLSYDYSLFLLKKEEMAASRKAGAHSSSKIDDKPKSRLAKLIKEEKLEVQESKDQLIKEDIFSNFDVQELNNGDLRYIESVTDHETVDYDRISRLTMEDIQIIRKQLSNLGIYSQSAPY